MKCQIIILILLILPNILFWSNVLITNGIIIQRDFTFPIFNENFEKYYYPLWNDITSQTNIERLPRLIIMSPFILLSKLGIDISYILKILIVSAFIFITTTTYLFFNTLQMYLKKEEDIWPKLFALLCSYIFAYSPTILQFSGPISFIISIAALPLLLYLILSKFNNKYFSLLSAICLLISLAHPFIFIMNVIISMSFIFIIYRTQRLIITRIVHTTVMFLGIFAWFWLPYINNPVSSIELGRVQNIERETFDIVSSNSFYKILFLERDKFVYINTIPEDPLLILFHYLSIVTLLSVAFIGFLFIKKLHYSKILLIFFCTGFIISTLLSLGSNGPIGELYWFFISNSDIGWIFRSPLKFQMYQAFFLSTLFILSLMFLSIKQKTKIYLLIFILIGSSYYGIYHANFFSMNPISIPLEYYEINDYLKKSDTSDYKVLYLPRYNEIATEWSQGHRIGSYDIKSSRIPTYDISPTGYSFIQEIIYYYPYTTEMLSDKDYYDFLSSIGIKYIVFHDDRGYALDQRNLKRLLESKELNLIFEKNGWYIFKIVSSAAPQIRVIHNINIADDIKDIYKLASPYIGVITINTSQLIREELELLESTLDNKLTKYINYLADTDWVLYNKSTFLLYTTSDYLRITTNSTQKFIWSNLISKEININANNKYLFTIELETKNVFGSHVKIQGFNMDENRWTDISYLTHNGTSLSIFGDTNWTKYRSILEIPSNINKIRFVINAGTVLDNNTLEAETLVRNVGMYNVTDLFAIKYSKISATQYKVYIDNKIETPFILTFNESYDKQWVAIDNNGKEFRNIQLYGISNGFYIDNIDGNIIYIKYKSQEYFYYGTIITIFFITIFLFYSSYRVINYTKLIVYIKHILHKIYVIIYYYCFGAMIRK